MAGWSLAIDFGTSFTTAAVAEGTAAAPGPVEVLEIENSRYLPSLVCLGEDGGLLVGRAAASRAAVFPELAERLPKRALVSTTRTRLGEVEFATVDLVAAVLSKVTGEALRRHNNRAPDVVVLTYPARWGEHELGLLRKAAAAAGLEEPKFVAEPVAAAVWYATSSVPVGAHVAVYDLGGGTFDTAVLRREKDGFRIVGPPGGDPYLGGEDFDEALLEVVRSHAERGNPAAWQDLAGGGAGQAGSSGARRAWAQLRRDVTTAKEALSEHPVYTVFPHGFDEGVRVTLGEFQESIEEYLRSSIEALHETVDAAGLGLEDITAIYLTGGASRVPRVSELLADELNRLPYVEGDPKAVTVLGALRYVGAVRESALPGAGGGSGGGTTGSSALPGGPAAGVAAGAGTGAVSAGAGGVAVGYPGAAPVGVPVGVPTPPQGFPAQPMPGFGPGGMGMPQPGVPQPGMPGMGFGPGGGGFYAPSGPGFAAPPPLPAAPPPPVTSVGLPPWTTATGLGPLRGVAVWEDLVIAAGAGLAAFRVRGGGPVWACEELRGAPLSPPTVADGVVYVCTPVEMVAVGAGDGRLRWRAPLPPGDFTGVPLVVGAAVYVARPPYQVVAFDARTGAHWWAAATVKRITSAVDVGTVRRMVHPWVSVSGRWLFVGTGGIVQVLDAGTGAQLLRITTGDRNCTAPVVEGGLAYIAGRHSLTVVHLASGYITAQTREAAARLVRTDYHFSQPLVADQAVYCGTFGGVVGVDKRDARPVWTSQVFGRMFGAPWQRGDAVFVASWVPGSPDPQASVSALVTSGMYAPRWVTPLPGGLVMDAPVVTDDHVLIGDAAGVLRALDPDTGRAG